MARILARIGIFCALLVVVFAFLAGLFTKLKALRTIVQKVRLWITVFIPPFDAAVNWLVEDG